MLWKLRHSVRGIRPLRIKGLPSKEVTSRVTYQRGHTKINDL